MKQEPASGRVIVLVLPAVNLRDLSGLDRTKLAGAPTALFGIALVASTPVRRPVLSLTVALARRRHDIRHGRAVRGAPKPMTPNTAGAANPDGR